METTTIARHRWSAEAQNAALEQAQEQAQMRSHLVIIGDSTTPTAEVLVDVKQKIAWLEDQLDKARVMANANRLAHEQDIARIGRRLLELAEEQDWCETFDEEIDAINESLTFHLPSRNREWDVSMNITGAWSSGYGSGTFEADLSMTVEASTAEEAESKAEEKVDGAWIAEEMNALSGGLIDEWSVNSAEASEV